MRKKWCGGDLEAWAPLRPPDCLLSSSELPGGLQTVPGTASSYRVTQLQPGVSYSFSLTPIREGVRGPEASVTQNTGLGTQPGAGRGSWAG